MRLDCEWNPTQGRLAKTTDPDKCPFPPTYRMQRKEDAIRVCPSCAMVLGGSYALLPWENPDEPE